MKFYQHIYVYKILLKKLNIEKAMNQTVILIFARYFTYLLIFCAIFQKENDTVQDTLV